MQCGKANLPDANFCCKCAAPFGVIKKPISVPQVQVGAIQAEKTTYRAPVPNLSRRERDRGRPRHTPKVYVENEEMDDDDEVFASVDSVPDIDTLQVEIAPDTSVNKVDLGNLLEQGRKDWESKNPKTRKPKK